MFRPTHDYLTAKALFASAFRTIRKNYPLTAKQSYLCCSGCALSDYTAYSAKHPTSEGLVFYHKQDADSFKETGRLYIGYASCGRPGQLTTKAIGEIIRKEFVKVGLTVDWNGATSSRIVAYLPTT